MQSVSDVVIYADRPLLYLARAVGLGQVYAGVDGPGVFIGHLPERIFDDARRIAAYAQLQEQDVLSLAAAEKIRIAPGRSSTISTWSF